MTKNLRASLALVGLSLAAWPLFAQQKEVTAADYARAESMLSYKTGPLINGITSRISFLPDGRLWYKRSNATGGEYVVMDPVKNTRVNGTDLSKLGVEVPKGNMNNGEGATSPDGKYTAFIRNYNLWIREEGTKKETQLTTDGIKDFGYATDNAGWTHSNSPVLRWSPDSKKIATFQQDERLVGDMYLVTTNVGTPKLEAWKYPLPGDKEIVKLHRVIIWIDGPKVVRLNMGPDAHRSTLCDDISCDGSFTDTEWSPDSKTLAYVASSRDHKEAKLRVADAATGDVKEIHEEKVATQYESGQGASNWRYLPNSNEFIWYSEKDDWGHLYLYDLSTGKLKNQITKGNFVVTRLLRVDEKKRELYFEANGREAGSDPYFSKLYKTDFAGKKITLLTPEEGNHMVSFSPDYNYIIDTYSNPVTPSTTVVRNLSNGKFYVLEKTDVSRLSAAGWKAPTQVTLKSRDGRWDLYGLMFTPTNLDPSKKYPVVNYIYPGPQGGGFGSRSFSASRSDHQALAELGFVVVIIDGTCNPGRSKSFHDICYGNMADNTLEDQISGIKQLAAKYPYMDLSRVGIWGHSGGGYATAAAMFRYPDFYKVGISESGNHENLNYEDDWGERYIGLVETGADKKNNYTQQANPLFAGGLKGKLMLAHGTMDDNVPPYNTYLVIDALTKANKDYDLVLIPNARHGYGAASYYMMRKRWDYFVENLMGATHPKEYPLGPKTATR